METLHMLVEPNHGINMPFSDAHSRISNLLICYKSLLCRHGLGWIPKGKKKLSEYHMLAAINPASLRNRIESDLEISLYQSRKNFRGLVFHIKKQSGVLKLVHSGPPQKAQKDYKKFVEAVTSTNNNAALKQWQRDAKKRKQIWVRYEEITDQSLAASKIKKFHLFFGRLRSLSGQEKKGLFDHFAKEKAATRPAMSKHSQTRFELSSKKYESRPLGRIFTSQPHLIYLFLVSWTDCN